MSYVRHRLAVNYPAKRSLHRWPPRYRRRQFARDAALAVAILVMFGVVAYLPLSKVRLNSPVDAIQHLASAPNCSMARLVGVAPARRGQPGYWPSHDADRDGIACEPWKGRR
ncbi:excalibur calcium-binding domain-containing protein [Allomesorhizobium alhagi]|uniref:excalibur calcium-binding domain-containing protein n=1 Tax=Allomesorhizobium alhagi TaxID=475067 RepID=UPI00111192E1